MENFESSSDDRMKSIERRLSRIEKSLNLSPGVYLTPQPAVPVKAAPAAQNVSPVPAAPVKPAAAPRPGSWLGIVAVICFVLAAGFIIKLSLDSGWLTPERQIGLAVIFGAALILAGLGLMRADRTYSSYLPAAGIIVLYASVFSAHRLYSLITFETTVCMTAVVSSLCIWLYTWICEDLYPVTAAFGSYLAPAILGLGAGSVFSVYYYLLCSSAFAFISIWVRSRILTMVSAYLAILMTAAAGVNLNNDILTVTMLALNFLVLSGGVYFYSGIRGTPLTESESMGFTPILMFFYATEYYFLDRLAPGLAPWISLGFAGVLLALYLAAKEKFPEGKMGSEKMVLTFVTVVVFHSFYLELLPPVAQPWLFVLIVVALSLAGTPLSFGREGGRWRIPAMAVMAALVIEYLSMASHLLSGNDPSWLFVSIWSVAAIWILVASRGREISGQRRYLPLLASAHLLAILALYRLTKDAGSLQVSASWLVYAVAVMAFAFSRRDEEMARSAIFVLSFAAGKALLYDAASAPTVIRIVCLILTGAVLYGAGFFLRKISGWKTPEAGPQKAAGV